MTQKNQKDLWRLLVRVRHAPIIARFQALRTMAPIELVLYERGLVRRRQWWMRSRCFGHRWHREMIYTITPRGRKVLDAGFGAWRDPSSFYCDNCAQKQDLEPSIVRSRGRCQSCGRDNLLCYDYRRSYLRGRGFM